MVGLTTASFIAPHLLTFDYREAILAVVIGSIIPDFDLYGTKKKFFKERTLLSSHRGWTHHIILALILILVSIIMQNPIIEGLVVGYCSHIFIDGFSPLGIPYWYYQDRISMNLYRTGKFSEYFVMFIIVVLGVINDQPGLIHVLYRSI